MEEENTRANSASEGFKSGLRFVINKIARRVYPFSNISLLTDQQINEIK